MSVTHFGIAFLQWQITNTFWSMIHMFHVYFRKYGLSDDTVDFIGHALALHRDDRYLDEPALDTVKRMKVSLGQSCFLVAIDKPVCFLMV
jgi:RAB protein geranylgeranyltransferase component A